jgi:ParB family chromosome partitioning protein
MPTRRPGLGKGLDALIPSIPQDSALPAAGVSNIPVEQIIPNPQQPRTRIDPEKLSELAASIREHGVIQPLVITRGHHPDQYVIIAGERRWQAAKEAGLKEVPVVLREASQQELLELALIENVQRDDLSPLETAEAYQRLQDEYNLTQDQISQRVGKSRVSITNTLRLLELSDEVKEALASGDLTEGHARPLHGLSQQAQHAALSTVKKQALNVRQTEELARRYKGEGDTITEKKPKPAVSPEIKDLEERLREGLQTDVKLSHSAKGGTLTLRYYSDEELNKLVELLIGEDFSL